MKPNIVIVEDHKMFLEGLISILEQENKYNILFTAKNGKNLIKYLTINAEHHIDLVITDISMPEMDGVELNSIIKDQFPTVKTLVISMHSDIKTINQLIDDKVDGYIPKDDTPSNELFVAIDTIISGKSYFSQKIKRTHANRTFARSMTTLDKLSVKEKKILQLIAMEHTTQEIADMMCHSKFTIDSYRKNLIAKLNVRNIAGLTKCAMRFGLLEEEDN